MFARLLAAFCLLLGSTSFVMASPFLEERTVLSLRLRSGNVRPAVLEATKRELADLMSTVGIPVRWENSTSYSEVSGSTVVVDLEGDCGTAFEASAAPLEEGSRIGSTATADGFILPFVKVNCSVLETLIGPFVINQPMALKEFFFGRALGRVLAHEVYHILTKSGDHASSGIAKARFSGAELTKNKFPFDDVALTLIHASRAAESVSSADSAENDDLADRAGEVVVGK
jgi:hypothetical protein